MTWRYVAHTADIRVAFEVQDLEALFADAVHLTRELVAGTGAEVEPRVTHQVALEGDGPAELLYGLLRDLLYRFGTEAFVPAGITVAECVPTRLRAAVHGEPFDPARHEPQPEVKAVTRHGLVVSRTDTGWRGEVVFDL